MAINLSDSIRVGQQKPIDDKYYNGLVPYVSTTEANSLLLSAIRYKGLTININNVEYWYKDGILDVDLIEKTPSLSGYVPYTGATQDVNLGEFGLQTGNIEFDLTPTAAPTTVGSMVWNDNAGTVDLKLKGGAVTLQIGQETVVRVVNKTATNINLLESNYQAVRVTGAQGQRPKVDLALANNDLNSTTTIGLVTETILNNEEGFITTSGQVQGINTTGTLQGETWADGDMLYLSGTVSGRVTNIKPIAPIHTVIMGFVEYAHNTQGKIFVKVDNGYELEELHNVSAIAPNNNEVLTYDTPTLLWKPKTVSTALGYTPVNETNLNLGAYKNDFSLVGNFTYASANLHAKATVSNGYLFICEYINNKIAVFDLSNQVAPTLIQEISTGSGSNPRDVAVFSDRYLIVACNTSAEIKIFDVTNPKSATLITTISTGAGSKDFVLVGKYLYLVCNGINQIQEWDLTNILSPFLSNTITTSSSPLSIDYSNNILAVVGLSQFLDIIPLDFTNKFSTDLTGLTHGTVKFFGNYILATDTDRDKLQVVNIQNIVSPTIVKEISSSVNPEEINIVGNYVFVPSMTDPGTNGKLDVFDFTVIADAVKIKTVELNNTGSGFCAVSGEYIYVTGHFSPYTIDIVKIPAVIVDDNRRDLNKKAISDAYLFNEISEYNFGVSQAGTWSVNNQFSRFGYKGLNTSGNYGFLQQSDGTVFIKGLSTKITGDVPIVTTLPQNILVKNISTNSIEQISSSDLLSGKQNLDATLTALAAYNTNGIITQTAADAFVGRTITGTANRVTVTNGDGVAGNPTLTLPQDIHTAAAPQFARLGLGAAANLASYLNVIANTTSVGQIYFPPSAVDYTGTLSGMLWNNASEWKFYDGVLSSVNRLIKLNGNSILANSNPLNVVTSTGVGGNVGTLNIETSFSRYPTAVSYTVLLTDVGFGWVIAVTSTAAARTITLPLANTVPAGWQITVKDESGGALTNNITISRAGSDLIEGATSNSINTNYGSRTLYSDGVSNWFII